MATYITFEPNELNGYKAFLIGFTKETNAFIKAQCLLILTRITNELLMGEHYEALGQLKKIKDELGVTA